MKGNFSGLLLGLVLLLTGCRSLPFDPPERADYRSVDPQAMVDEFDATVAKDFELLQSVVFEFFGKTMTGMGYLVVDDATDSYMLSCMTPTGIKLFEFRGEGDQVEALFLPPQLEKVQEQFIDAVAQDIREIYLDWVPSPDAGVKRKKYEVVWKEGRRRYIFAGPDRTLAEKQARNGWRVTSRIHYFKYEKFDGKWVPMAVVLENRIFHYRLILRVKSVQSL
jgi:hypothetical protein